MRRQQVASHLASYLASDTSNCKHAHILSFQLCSPSDAKEIESVTASNA
jgi:hypothetical protein